MTMTLLPQQTQCMAPRPQPLTPPLCTSHTANEHRASH
eukprot:CAMPEP_0185745372 /NCGR_PEP_ID=MMETSP1174-20130828/3686_1 /TAXON_ID=35687 /ORGANISM="Dictyocha speculum, Strain CCMP1381" /LENGTH=37 /DNA_ID= /DNA_START= /DNA_END= /DNA_ORIENTATION=